MTDLGAILPALKEGMGDVDFAILQEFVERKQVEKGDVVVSAGAPVNTAFFVIDGRFSVDLGGEAFERRELSPAGPGRWIGQMFFLSPSESSVTLTALEDATIGCLDKDAFEKLSASYPSAAGKLLNVLSLDLSNNLRQAGKLLFRRFAWDQVEGSEGEESAKQWFAKVFCELNGFSA